MDEYVIMNKSDLTTMADTIRETLGSTDSIAVGNLANKLVESIQAGGGGGGAKIAFTEITPASNTLNLTFNHNLGEKPNFIVWASNVSYNTYIRAHLFGLCFDLQEQDISWIYIMYKWTSSSTPQNTISIGKSHGKLSYDASGYGVISYDENQITFGSNGTNIVNFISGKSVVVITGVIQ